MGTRKTTIAILAAVSLASCMLTARNTEAAPPTGGKAGSQMNGKGRTNTNAQWSADPEKGWVRAEDRHQIQQDKKENSKRNHVNRKGNGSKKKF